MMDHPTGPAILHDPRFNKGTAFTEAEREALGLRGLLPPRVATQEQQLQRVMGNYGAKRSNLEKYIFLIALQDRNETLFYRTLLEHVEEMLPIVYTPTVGELGVRLPAAPRDPRGLGCDRGGRGADGVHGGHGSGSRAFRPGGPRPRAHVGARVLELRLTPVQEGP